jgi:hypothetical protein
MTDRQSWLDHCVDEFEWLAEHDGKTLLDLIEGGSLRASELTFAAEHAGLLGESAIPYLVPLLEHPKSYVREGAIIGLVTTKALDQHPEVVERIKQLADSDPSEELREVAREALNG